MAAQQRTQFSIRFLFLMIVGSAITVLLVQKFGVEKTTPYILTLGLALVLYAGYVDVVVVQADVERAKLLLKEWNQNAGDG